MQKRDDGQNLAAQNLVAQECADERATFSFSSDRQTIAEIEKRWDETKHDLS
jgi:hypothetical protein